MRKLSISEVFYSIQGEGPSMGKRSVFLRLAGCNLMCGGQGTQFDGQLHNEAKWRCDTIEVWMKGKALAFHEILNEDHMGHLCHGAHLIITGGEPMLQQQSIVDYLETFDIPLYVEIETNGTIAPNDKLWMQVSQWNISPKLKSSGNATAHTYKHVLHEYDNSPANCAFKFVITCEEDIEEIISLELTASKVWLMPAASEQGQLSHLSSLVAKLAMERGFNYSHRLQVAIWNQTTGV